MNTKLQMTSGLYADGSFGYRATTNGGMLTIWFCGRRPYGTEPSVRNCCPHRTRAEARSTNPADHMTR